MFFDPKLYYYMIGNDMVSFDKIWHYKIWCSILLYYIALLFIQFKTLPVWLCWHTFIMLHSVSLMPSYTMTYYIYIGLELEECAIISYVSKHAHYFTLYPDV